MIRAGIPNVVAACGSAWSPERTGLLSPWSEIGIVPDGDLAGSSLPARASSLRFRSRVRVAVLPPGSQPDDLAAEDLRSIVESALELERTTHPSVKIAGFRWKEDWTSND